MVLAQAPFGRRVSDDGESWVWTWEEYATSLARGQREMKSPGAHSSAALHDPMTQTSLTRPPQLCPVQPL